MAEIIMTCGFPSSGKTTFSQDGENRYWYRFNRDTLGGTLKDVAKKFSETLQKENPGNYTYVFDNTYPTRESRKDIIDIAKKYNIKIKCVWLQTSLEDSQFNACLRMYERYKCLLSPEEIKRSKDPNIFPPTVQYKYRKDFEEPSLDEGFDEIILYPFKRKQESKHNNKGLLLDYDGTLRETKSGNNYPVSLDDIRILPGRKEILDRYAKDGYTLVGISNQSGIHKGILTWDMAYKCFKETNRLLGLDIPVLFCPHQSKPISCYCRKPMPGHGVMVIEGFKLDASQSIMVGDMTTDETFAKRCGFNFIHTDKFFK